MSLHDFVIDACCVDPRECNLRYTCAALTVPFLHHKHLATASVADRRHCLRFEIVGRLRGTLATEAAVRLRDLSVCGVQIEAPWPLPIDTVHRVRLESDTQLSVIDARVRHVRAISERDYVIGLEFIAAEPAAQDHLHRIVARDADGMAHRLK